MARQLLAIAAGLLVVSMVTPATFAAQDELVIRMPNKKVSSVRGTIKQESLKLFRIMDPNGQPMPDFTGEQILEVRWDIPDFEYMRAKELFEKNQFAAAATSFQACLDSPNLRKAARAYVALMCGDSYRRGNKPEEAEKVLESLIEKHPESWYIPQAIDKLVDACAASGNFKKMTPLLSKLRALPGSTYKAKATMYEGRMYQHQKRIDAAMNKFNEAASATSDPETRGQAKMMLADCYVSKGDYKKAQDTAKAAITKEAPKAVLAYAHLVIGNTYYQQAMNAKGDAAKGLYLDAILEYLRVWTLYPGQERVEGEALYKAGESFKFLSRLPGRRSDRRRAANMFSTVNAKFPGSSWAKKAAKAMAEVK